MYLFTQMKKTRTPAHACAINILTLSTFINHKALRSSPGIQSLQEHTRLWSILHGTHASTLRYTMHCAALHYNTMHCAALHYNTTHCAALHYTIHCAALRYNTMHCAAL
eukprot:Lankesteria_metandrocarpae@DN4268_c0_g1_i4.p1